MLSQRGQAETKPCEHCGKPVTRTKTQQSQRKYWTCGRSCANARRAVVSPLPAWQPNPARGQQETRACITCGQSITRYLTPRIAARDWWACSVRCAAIERSRHRVATGTWQRPNKRRRGDTIACIACGKEFYRQPAYIAQNRRYCSRACWYQHARQEQLQPRCRTCGQPFTVAPSGAEQVYCSLGCRDEFIRRSQRACLCAQCGQIFMVKPSEPPRRCCSQRCRLQYDATHSEQATGQEHNGRLVTRDRHGYRYVYEPSHPSATRKGRIAEHRYVVEQRLGRLLRSDEHVHHLNGDKGDNRDENLEVLSRREHGHKTATEHQQAQAALRAQIVDLEQQLAAAKAALNGDPED